MPRFRAFQRPGAGPSDNDLTAPAFVRGQAEDVSWNLWSRYAVAALSIVTMIGLHHLASMLYLHNGAQDEELINKSGRQRMLSQRILFLAERYVETGSTLDLAQLTGAVDDFELSHSRLTVIALRDSRLAELYGFGRSTGLDQRARAYIIIARQIESATATPAVTAMQMDTLVRIGRDGLLRELNDAVTGFEAVANARSQQLKQVQNIALATALVIMILEFFFIFRPLNGWVVRTIRRLDLQANYDALTGLENRRRFIEGLGEQMTSRGEGSSVVVVAMDLDGFKSVNDVLGHPAGDAVLRHVAELLSEEAGRLQIAQAPRVSRLGGDEFFMCFTAPEASAARTAEVFGAAMIERLALPVPITVEDRPEQCLVGISLGYTVSAEAPARIDSVVADADIALYHSKRAGKGRITGFRPEMRDAAVSRLHRETELRRGLMDGEFEPFLQPQVFMDSGAFAGFEALARWRHPVRGLLAPDAFLDNADETNLLNAIEGSLIFQALDMVARMEAEGLRVPMISLNVSEASLRDDGFVENLMGTCAMLGIAPEAVTIEILETLTVDGRNERPRAAIRDLVAAGFQTAIDDFGTGYSSLAAVSALEFHYLKVDKSLVFRMGEGRVEKVLAATVGMATGMGVTVVAEGIETQRAYDTLRAMGCDIAQGYLIGKPMQAADARDWLRRRQSVDRAARSDQRRA